MDLYHLVVVFATAKGTTIVFATAKGTTIRMSV